MADNATMEGQDAFVQDLVATVPELAQLVKNASAQGASADAFDAMFRATTWYRSNADTARTQIGLQATDPASYQQNLTQAQQHVKMVATQMGVPLTDAQVASYATADLYQGLNDDQLKANIGGSFSTASPTATATGDVADYTQQLQALAASYGVPVTSTWINQTIQTAMSSGQSAQEMAAGARQGLINSASTAYPTLAPQLQQGQTVHDIAQPYIATMSNLLEIPDTQINVTDPMIQKALTNPTLTPNPASKNATTPGATPGMTNTPGMTSMPLYQFQDALRQDPRWQQTDNAKQSAYSMVASLGKQWGFAS